MIGFGISLGIPPIQEAKEMLYQFDHPYVLSYDNSKPAEGGKVVSYSLRKTVPEKDKLRGGLRWKSCAEQPRLTTVQQ